MDNIISLDEARKNKEKQELKKLPQTVTDYLELRELQIKSINEIRAVLKEFEENKLCLSKVVPLTGPQIDLYVSYKINLLVAIDNLHYNDEKVKAIYPNLNIPVFE